MPEQRMPLEDFQEAVGELRERLLAAGGCTRPSRRVFISAEGYVEPLTRSEIEAASEAIRRSL